MATRTRQKPAQSARDRRDASALEAEVARLKTRLADAEQRLRDLLEGSLQGVMVHWDNRLKFVNAAFAEIFGYPSVQAVLAVEDWQQFQAPSERERMEGYRSARLRGDHPPTRYEFEGRRRDGSPVWLENVVRIIAWDGHPAILATLLDVTDRHRMEEELRLSEERFRVAFEYAPLGISVGIHGQGWLQVNDGLCAFLGRPREELLNHPAPIDLVREASHPEDFEPDARMFARLLAGEIDTYQMEKRYFRPTGEMRWGQLAVSTSRDASGATQYIIAHVVDITARKQAEAALRESEERFRVAFEQAPIGLALGNPASGWKQVNRAFTNFLDLEPDDPTLTQDLVTQLHAYCDPEDVVEHLRLHNELVAGTRDSFELVKRYRLRDGSIRWASLHVAATRNPDRSLKWLVSQRLDITARKLAEEAQRESEERFRIAFDHAPIGIALGTPADGFLQANAAICEFFGRSREDLLSQRNPAEFFRQVTHPEDRPADQAHFQRLMARQVDFYQMENRYFRPAGEVRWGRVAVAASRAPGGSLRFIILQIADITSQKQAEQALRESEERFRIAFDHAPLGIAVAVPGRGWVQINQALEHFLGRPREELLGRRDVLEMIREFSHPDDFERNAVAFRRLMAGEIDAYQMEKRYVRPSGEVRWGFLNVAASRDPAGAVRYTVSQVADITALKQTEQALREREASLAAAQSITHLGSWEEDLVDPHDRHRNPLRWSDEVFRIFGYEPGTIEVSNENFFAHVHPDDRARIQEAVAHAMAARGQYTIEYRVVRPGGGERILREQSEILYDPDTGAPLRMRGTVQDITEQKEFEIKLVQSQKLESLGLLAGGIAHDFNNLLTGILGYASLSQQSLPPGSPLHEYLGQIEAGGRRAAELCQQMLAYAGRGRFEVRLHDINAIVRDTVPLLEVSISKKIALRLRLAEPLPPVEVDGSQIRQIVMNLVTNAADAIGNAAGRIDIAAGVMQAGRDYLAQTYLAPDLPEGSYVFLEVSDTGTGMAPEVQKRIFDPFFTTKFAGRGLGLAAVLGIVRAHRGALKVYSEPGRGSILRLLLPAATGPLPLADAPAPAAWRGEGLALVIDDEAGVRGVAARLLESLGFTVVAAADGREGVASFRAQAQPVRLVLLDLTMPHMDGEETFRALTEIDPGVTVVLMSGFTQQEALDRFAGTGLAAFLQKPFTLASLRETLQGVFTGGAVQR